MWNYIKETKPRIKKDGQKQRMALYECICGTRRIVIVSNVTYGYSHSCGCVKSTRYDANPMRNTPEYRVWATMKTRCLNKNDTAYDRYGGRGIKVCKEWMRFKNFYKDMGAKKDGYELDRKNNNLGYNKDNCRWVAKITNMQNTRRSKRWVINDVCYLSLGFAAETLNVSREAIRQWCDGHNNSGYYYPPKPGCYSFKYYK